MRRAGIILGLAFWWFLATDLTNYTGGSRSYSVIGPFKSAAQCESYRLAVGEVGGVTPLPCWSDS